MGKANRNRRRRDSAAPQSSEAKWTADRAAHRVARLRDEVLERLTDNQTHAERMRETHQAVLKQMVAHTTAYGAGDPVRAALRAMYADGVDPRSRDLPAAISAHHHRRMLAQVRLAEPYVISPAMHATASAAAETLAEEDCAHMEESEVPAAHGMLLLPGPQLFQREKDPAPMPIAAIGWSLVTIAHPWHGWVRDREVPATVTALAVRVWADLTAVSDAGITAIRRLARENGEDLPTIIPFVSTHLLLGDEVDGMSRAALRAASPDITPPPELVRRELTGHYDATTVLTGALDSWALRYLFAFFRLCRQQIGVTPRLREDGEGARRPYDAVRVVTLRSYTEIASPSEQSRRQRRYEHRWMVRMHRVNQWYPSEGVHRIIWRGPYIKGPEDAPLLAGEKVYALTR